MPIQNVFVSMVDTFAYCKIMLNIPVTISSILHGDLYSKKTDYFLVFSGSIISISDVVSQFNGSAKKRGTTYSRNWNKQNIRVRKMLLLIQNTRMFRSLRKNRLKNFFSSYYNLRKNVATYKKYMLRKMGLKFCILKLCI